MTAIQFGDVLVLLAVCLAANTLGGVAATILAVVVLSRRHDTELHNREREHLAEVARIEDENAREKREMKDEIERLKAQTIMLMSMLQARNVLSSGDVVQLTTSRDGKVLAAMRELFSREELEVLAHSAGLSIDSVGGDSLPVVALRLLQEAERTGRYHDLVGAIKRARPNVAL